VNDITSTSADEKTLVIRSHSDRDPGTYYVLDLQQGRMVPLGRAMRGLDPQAMRPMEPISFQARDGLTIHGYLTRPADAGQGPAPLVINPHGGPYTIRDSWGFNPEVQLLANRGYAVLQVNYRGSGGYGVKFLQAGYHEWGGKMQDDLTDAVKWAIAQGITTADRVAIYGASYGGYAALAGLTFTPELYRCGINYVGVSDLGAQIADYKISFSPYYQLFASQQVGDDRAYLHDRSPVNFVQNIRAPLLNAYGYNDARVDIRQWKLLEPALKKYGKTYEIIINDKEGHGFQNEAARLDFYHRLEAFLARHLPVK
jgi:dipeptidyl aminopeptidase/acylaminoacyl peptidase